MDRISVIIPAYNREAYLGEAIESVLEQTRPADEIIVVDDGSTDRTMEIAGGFARVICLSQSHQGISVARNRGLHVAEGELIAFLDSDDLWLPRKLELQTECLRARPEIDLVFCGMRSFLSPELNADAVGRFDDTERPGLSSSCLLARREAFSRTGLLNPKLVGGEFIEWFGRAEEAGLLHHVVPELLVRRRVHLTNAVRDRTGMNRDYLRILKDQLARRRSLPDPS